MDDLGAWIMVAAGLGSLGCSLIVLFAIFTREGVALGMVGLLCNLVAFVWGWSKAESYGLRRVMMVWTSCLVLSLLGAGLLMPRMLRAAEEQSQGETDATGQEPSH
ncbi:MAG: hypothetical protein Q7Q71_15595 [Verrucomicrobiota bacterium JB023]|nr:hypothetical protein [Verrucomicrobiota bacterium JB023]